VYIETSVWGMTLPNQPRALRQPTQQFLRQCRAGHFRPCISTVVFDEIALAPASALARMLREVDALAPETLQLTDESEQLAEAYLRAGVIPAKKRDDARHVAIATVAGLEIVVSWNHRHLDQRAQMVPFQRREPPGRLRAGLDNLDTVRGHAMKAKYETLDEYLDDLDAIKAAIAEKTDSMTPEQVQAYFAGAEQRLRELAGQKPRPRRHGRKATPAKP